MPCTFDIPDHHHCCLSNVCVVSNSLLNISFVVHVEVSLQFVTMSYETSLLELCHCIEIEPSLQPLSGESFLHRSANVEDGAHLDVVANGFWERGQNAYFVFNPFALTHCSVSLPQCYGRVELEKKKKYEEKIWEVEHGRFSPLVFSCTGGMGHSSG